MKRLINTIYFLLAIFAVNAQPTDSLQKANNLYAEDKIPEAISTYENIVVEGYESAALYYNLGNAYYKSGEVTKAILNFERAKLIDPTDEDILFNLEMANTFVVDKIEDLPRPFFVKWGESILNLMNSNGWAITSLICFVIALLFGAGYFFSSSVGFKKLAFAVTIVIFSLSVITFVFSSNQQSKITNRTEAIIFTPTVTVKASPADSGTDLFVIHEGLKIEIVDQLNEWIEIKLKDGNSGWVKSSVLERI